MVSPAQVPGSGRVPSFRTVISVSLGAVALGAGMLLGLTDVHAMSAPVRHAELLPPEPIFVDTQALGCARAHLRDLQATTTQTRAQVAQRCTALLMESEMFVFRSLPKSHHDDGKRAARKARKGHRRHAANVQTGRAHELPWDVEEESTEVSADELRYLLGRHAVAALHGYLSARADEEPACSKVVVRYGLDNRCKATVDVQVLDAANTDVEADIRRLMKRSMADAREGLDCNAIAATLDGEVSLIPVRSGPSFSLLGAR